MLQLMLLRGQGIVSAEQLFQQPHIQAQMHGAFASYMAQHECERARIMAQCREQTMMAMEHQRAWQEAERQDRIGAMVARASGQPAPRFTYTQDMYAAKHGVPTQDFRTKGAQQDHMAPKSITARAVEEFERRTGQRTSAATRSMIGSVIDTRYPGSKGSDPANKVHTKAENKVLMSVHEQRPYTMTKEENAHANWAAVAARDAMAQLPDTIEGQPKAVFEECYKDMFRYVVDPTGRTPLDYARWL